MVDINKVVNIDLNIATPDEIVGQYDTVLYLTSLAGDDAVKYETASDITNEGLKAQANIFFNNGGKKLLVAKPTEFTGAAIEELVKSMHIAGHKFLYVVLARANMPSSTDTVIDIANRLYNMPAPYNSRLCITLSAEENKYTDSNMLIKLCGGSQDAALAFGAYTTKINLSGYDTINDYCYTPETADIIYTYNSVKYQDYIKSYNFVDKLGNRVLNFGGNLANGISADIDFGVMCLENDIANGVAEIISNKVKINPQGQSLIISKITSILSRYVTNGLIQPNGVYTDTDYLYKYSTKTYTIVKQGAVLLSGYSVFGVPTSAITADDKQNKKFTPIIIVIITAAGARTITIQGEVK